MQGRLVFDVGGLLASFIVSATGKTIFVGLYKVQERGLCTPGTVWPFDGADASGAHLHGLVLDERLAGYADRLVIAWGAVRGHGSSVQPTSRSRYWRLRRSMSSRSPASDRS